MRFITIAFVLCTFVIGCREPENKSKAHEHGRRDSQNIHRRGIIAPPPTLLPNIEQKVDEFDDVEDFVAWLRKQPGVTGVNVNKKLLLTTDPPQVAVLFKLNGNKKRMLLLVEPETKLKLAKPSQ